MHASLSCLFPKTVPIVHVTALGAHVPYTVLQLTAIRGVRRCSASGLHLHERTEPIAGPSERAAANLAEPRRIRRSYSSTGGATRSVRSTGQKLENSAAEHNEQTRRYIRPVTQYVCWNELP